ncbi:hypothetical protein OS493_025656 [Desmophyllum pertusum]|uniref:Uncharacterized protein n=1 Tax=Desmophyllum pertusum TaxID=174260 RepID=A0A9W9ZZW2_9CNID|nr:hypothetical protein OS493_025656 [Desmophyllum pertusum]
MLEKLLQLAQLCDTKLQKDLQSVLIKTAVWPVVKLNSMVRCTLKSLAVVSYM